jgi:hypothetical protein
VRAIARDETSAAELGVDQDHPRDRSGASASDEFSTPPGETTGVHPGYLVDDRKVSRRLISDARVQEDALDLWLMAT